MIRPTEDLSNARANGYGLLAVRIMAVWVAVTALLNACEFGWVLVTRIGEEHRENGFALGMGLTIVLEIVLAVGLFVGAPRLVRGLGEHGAGADVAADRFEIGALALRLAGITIIDQALMLVPRIVSSIERPLPIDDSGERLLAIFQTLVLCAIGVALIWRPRPIARRLYKTSAPRETSASELAQAIAFSVLGLWLFLGSLPEVMQTLYYALRAPPMSAFFGLDTASGVALVFVHAVRCAAGIVLFLSAEKIARYWHRLRRAGLPESAR